MRTKLYRELTAALLVAVTQLQSATTVAPEWWGTRGVFKAGTAADDYAVANLGQLKNIARKAAQELEEGLFGGAGEEINALIASWVADPLPGVSRDDYAALNLGQLKRVAKPFYDRLADGSSSVTYPWSGTATDDHALANVGQLKRVFSFTIVEFDSDNDGLPDAWEMEMFGNLDQDADDDFDLDDLTNYEEFLAGTRADLTDTDGDGVSDSQEMVDGTDPTNASSSTLALTGLRVFTPIRSH